MAENLAEHRSAARPTASSSTRSTQPIHTEGGINVLTGSLAPKGSVVKVAGLQQRADARSRARRACSTARTARWTAILAGSIEPGTVLVIRYEGPKGGPGMREMLAITGALKGAGRGADCALITDGRFSRRHVGLLHRPRRPGGGRRRPDRVRAATATDPSSTCTRSASTCWSTTPSSRRRREGWAPTPPRYTRGVLGKYAELVQGAETGAITNPL